MGVNPTDLGKDFIQSGKRLVTQLSSDSLLKKSHERTEKEQEEFEQKLHKNLHRDGEIQDDQY